MPELPEVETTARGIAPHISGRRIERAVIREARLRWPVSENLASQCVNLRIHGVSRRGKYLLIEVDAGHIMIHLGMSGSLRIVAAAEPPRIHDHIDFVLNDDTALRYHDPRRFGSVFWLDGDPLEHNLLKDLGPEPLSAEFNADYLFQRCRKRKQAIKTLIMDSHVVVGVGNIYANEALFRAGIRPRRAAGRVSRKETVALVEAIKDILAAAIELGGTTLRDFVGGDGEPGYFQQTLQVYGRGGLPCRSCKTELKLIQLGQRATVYCPSCQR